MCRGEYFGTNVTLLENKKRYQAFGKVRFDRTCTESVSMHIIMCTIRILDYIYGVSKMCCGSWPMKSKNREHRKHLLSGSFAIHNPFNQGILGNTQRVKIKVEVSHTKTKKLFQGNIHLKRKQKRKTERMFMSPFYPFHAYTF